MIAPFALAMAHHLLGGQGRLASLRAVQCRAEPVLWPIESLEGAGHEFVHIHGLPWEATNEDLETVLATHLPLEIAKIVEVVQPLDRRARTTGRGYVRLELVEGSGVGDVVAALKHKCVGERVLDVRPALADEYAFQKREAVAISERVHGRARQSYCRPTVENAPFLPTDPRDIILLCHDTPAAIGRGRIDLNNLPHGRLDVLARCVTSSLFVSYAMRSTTRLWLLLVDLGLAVVVDGGQVEGLHPDERTLAAAIRRTLLSHTSEEHQPPPGWTLRGVSPGAPAALEHVLSELATEWSTGEAASSSGGVQFIMLHEQGAHLSQHLAVGASNAGTQREQPPPSRTVLILGDHLGFTEEEEACLAESGAAKASLGPVPLLASQCIVLAHAALDAVAYAAGTEKRV